MTLAGCRVWSLVAALVAPILFESAALAQTALTIPPPTYTFTDANGVDLTTGNMGATTTSISVGAGSKTLSFNMTFDSSAGATYVGNGYGGIHAYGGGRFRTNLEGQAFVTHQIVNGVGQINTIISVGDRSEDFRWIPNSSGTYDGTSFMNIQGDGSTLTGSFQNYAYTTPDSTVYNFQYQNIIGSTETADITSVIRPDGEILSYFYTSYALSGAAATGFSYGNYNHLQAIKSSLGYQIQFQYDSNYPAVLTSATAFNASVDYCDPTSNSCSFSQIWPTLNITTNNAGSTTEWVQTVTDSLSRQSAYWVSAQTYAGGQPGLVQILRPSQQALSSNSVITRTYTSTLASSISALTDGPRTWNYNLNYAANFSGNEPQQMAAADPANKVRSLTFYTSDPNLQLQSQGKVQSDQDANGNTTNYNYDTYGRISDITHPEGDREHYDYDSHGNVIDLIRYPKPSVGGTPITVSATFNNCGNPITCAEPDTATDANSNVTHYTYDPTHGGVLTVIKPAAPNGVQAETWYEYGQIPTFAKNSSGNLAQVGAVWRLTKIHVCRNLTLQTCAGTVDETVTTISYVGSNHADPTSVTVSAGDGSLVATTQTTYDNVGNLASTMNPKGVTTSYFYDAMRQKTYEVGPDINGDGNHLTTYTHYTPDGLVDQVQVGVSPGGNPASFSAQQTLSSTYDAQDFKLQDWRTGGAVTQIANYSYDAAGRPLCKALRMNKAAFAGLVASPLDACTLGATGADGPDRITQAVYDPGGRQTSVIQSLGTANQRTYEAISYGSDGEQMTDADANGNLTQYTYDGFNRLIQVNYPNTSGGGYNPGDLEKYMLDAAGNITAKQLRDGSTLISSYDALERKQIDWNGAALGYDNLGHITSATLGSQVVSMTYDALGRKTSESNNTLGTIGYGYDLTGARTQITWPDKFSVTYNRNAAEDVTAILENRSFVLANYSYDDLGARTGIGRANSVSTGYGYDGLSHLNALSHSLTSSGYNQAIGFTRNAAGQIIGRTSTNSAYDWTGATPATRSYNPDGLNRITTSGPYTLSYLDGRGNLTSDSLHSYGYTPTNQLTSYGSGGVTATLTYDPLGRLVQTSGSAAATTQFVYAGDQLLTEYDGSGNLLRRYVPGAEGADDPVVWYEGASTGDRRWLLDDERGSVVGVTNASGALISSPNTYDEYGYPGGSNQGRFQYTGQLWIPEIGLYYYKARTYSPTLGRFMQTDPIGYTSDLNLYAYVGDDPINGSDRSGLACNAATPASPNGQNNQNTLGSDPSAPPTVDEVEVCGQSRKSIPSPGIVMPIKVSQFVPQIQVSKQQPQGNQQPKNSCPTGPLANFAQGARQFGSNMQAAGDWTAVAGTGVAGLGAVALQPEIVASGGAGIIVGKGISVIGLGVQLLAGAYLYQAGDPRPLTSTAAGQAAGALLPPALPGYDPAGDIGDAAARRAYPNLPNC